MNVLLTGAAGGVGRAMAVECGKRGYDLFLTDMDEAALRRVQAGLERRRKGKPFTAVFVSSLASLFPMPLKATYAASKRFLLDFATALRQELRGEGVNVLALCPAGMVTTEKDRRGYPRAGVLGRGDDEPAGSRCAQNA